MATKKRLIDANALIAALRSKEGAEALGHTTYRLIKVLSIIDGQPTVDAVEVVRCNECRWYLPECECCQFWHGRRHKDHFCSEGERRTDHGRSDVSGGDTKSTGAKKR